MATKMMPAPCLHPLRAATEQPAHFRADIDGVFTGFAARATCLKGTGR